MGRSQKTQIGNILKKKRLTARRSDSLADRRSISLAYAAGAPWTACWTMALHTRKLLLVEALWGTASVNEDWEENLEEEHGMHMAIAEIQPCEEAEAVIDIVWNELSEWMKGLLSLKGSASSICHHSPIVSWKTLLLRNNTTWLSHFFTIMFDFTFSFS